MYSDSFCPPALHFLNVTFSTKWNSGPTKCLRPAVQEALSEAVSLNTTPERLSCD